MSFRLFSKNTRTAKKQHRCIWCGEKILISEKYVDERSLYDDNIQRHRWHLECNDDSIKYFTKSCENEFSAYENERPIVKIKL